MFLSSTSDIVRVVTGSAVANIECQASWVDSATGSYSPGRTDTEISTATTTTVVASPAASTVRNVKTLQITNNHASSSCVVTIQHFDGTTSIDIEKITLNAGEQFVMAEDGEWRHLTAYGAEYEYSAPGRSQYGISGGVAESIPRNLCNEGNISGLTSGSLAFQAVYLRAGQVVTNISFFSATTAAGTPTNQFFALYSAAGVLLAQSANDTTNAWAANTIKTLAMTSPYTVRQSGLYYLALMVTATTVPTLKGVTRSTTKLTGMLPTISINSAASGLTTALPDNFSTFSSSGLSTFYWACVT